MVRQEEVEEKGEEVLVQEEAGERGAAEQEEEAKGQQQEPEEVVEPMLWQWLKVLQGSHSSLMASSRPELEPQYREAQSLEEQLGKLAYLV